MRHEMFSARSTFPSEANVLTRAIAAARHDGRALLDLTASNPTTVGLPYDERRILGALSRPEALTHDPAAFGLPTARTAIAERLGLDPNRLVLTASTSEAYAFLFDLLCDPGDEILVPRPSYPLVEWLAQLEGVVPRYYDLSYDGEWHVDAESFARALGPLCRAIVCVSPNNPTGHVLGTRDRALFEATGLPLIVDEVFAAYPVERRDTLPLVTTARDGLCFALSGLSKLAALPQLKLGFIAISGEDALVHEAMTRLESIADTFLSVAAPVQHAVGTLLDVTESTRAAIRERARRNLARIDAALASSSPITRLRVEAGWYVVLRLPAIASEDAFALALLEDGVIVQPGWLYDMSEGPFCVISLLTPEAELAAGIDRIAARVAALASTPISAG